MKYLSALLLLVLGAVNIPSAVAQIHPDTIGFTQYDMQTVGSTGRRITVDNRGGLHFTWMNGEPFPSTRQVYYNYLGPDGSPWPGIGQAISYKNGDGYSQIDIYNGRLPAIIYHNARFAGGESLYCAVAQDSAFESFGLFHPPNRLETWGLCGHI